MKYRSEVTFEIPMALPSLPNQRGHWARRAGLAKRQRAATTYSWLAAGRPKPSFPAVVTITRVGPRLLDSDNLVASAKHVRDELAECFGLPDDAGDEVRWVVRQLKVPSTVGVQVTISAGEIAFYSRKRVAP